MKPDLESHTTAVLAVERTLPRVHVIAIKFKNSCLVKTSKILKSLHQDSRFKALLTYTHMSIAKLTKYIGGKKWKQIVYIQANNGGKRWTQILYTGK